MLCIPEKDKFPLMSSFNWLNTMPKLFRKKKIQKKIKQKKIISVWYWSDVLEVIVAVRHILLCISRMYLRLCRYEMIHEIYFVWLGAFWADNMLSSFEGL